MASQPDFYLTAFGESDAFADGPRACWIKGRATDGISDFLILRISPALIRQKYNMRADIEELLISPRYTNTTLSDIRSWPFHVYISRFQVELMPGQTEIGVEQVKLVAWGMIWPTLNEAEKAGGRTV